MRRANGSVCHHEDYKVDWPAIEQIECAAQAIYCNLFHRLMPRVVSCMNEEEVADDVRQLESAIKWLEEDPSRRVFYQASW